MLDLLRRWFGSKWWVVGYDGVWGPMRYKRAEKLALRTGSGWGWSPIEPTIRILKPGEETPKPVTEWTMEELQQWLTDHRESE